MGFLADAVVVVHCLFVGFVLLGCFLALRWPKVAWLQVPAALYGVLIEWFGWVCPLTPLENSLRARAGEGTYEGGFVEHYLLPALYPAGLTPASQRALGALVLVVNLTVYAFVWHRERSRRS